MRKIAMQIYQWYYSLWAIVCLGFRGRLGGLGVFARRAWVPFCGAARFPEETSLGWLTIRPNLAPFFTRNPTPFPLQNGSQNWTWI